MVTPYFGRAETQLCPLCGTHLALTMQLAATCYYPALTAVRTSVTMARCIGLVSPSNN